MISRLASRQAATAAARVTRSRVQAVTSRNMGGGGAYLQLSPIHKAWGEAFGCVCWLWIFHRARQDGAVVLGYRHPWDHAEDPLLHAAEAPLHPDDESDLETEWDVFLSKAIRPGEDDDDDDDDDEDDEDEDEDEEDDDE
eukprot:CAMPEP_0119006524 /NCGR_PEP_ID=MMETSP1176-20130426/2338_1 /TAXON_ID=265551 /ORGANISM="Synedropsis recta cf, Strain CCMP1620" /LENGTH=139 /DNA_ID=CAMNT_0006958441 /DNA_START=98 /DNA_END=517 /DNA_ORIENTATION=+